MWHLGGNTDTFNVRKAEAVCRCVNVSVAARVGVAGQARREDHSTRDVSDWCGSRRVSEVLTEQRRQPDTRPSSPASPADRPTHYALASPSKRLTPPSPVLVLSQSETSMIYYCALRSMSDEDDDPGQGRA